MGSLIISPVPQVFGDDGSFGAGYKLHSYEPGTSTDKALYTDRACTVAAANPVVMDTRGQATVYGLGLYKLNLLTADDAQVSGWPIDNVSGIGGGTEFMYIGDYSNNLSTAVTAIGATEATLFINAATSVAGNVTVPETLKIVMQKGGTINQGTYTIIFNGPFEAAPHQVFTGTGLITFTMIEKVCADWFGSGRNRSTISNMLTSLGTSNQYEIALSNDSTWDIDDDLDLSGHGNLHFGVKNGCLFSVAGGKTLTWNSPEQYTAPFLNQIFTGAGDVAFDRAGVISPHWYNSDAYTNAYEAFSAAMQSAMISTEIGHCSIHAPGGDYTFSTSGALSNTEATSKVGILITGDGWFSTRFLLDTSGASSDMYFYNNVSTARLMFPVFENIGFFGYTGVWTSSNRIYANINQYAKGFRIYSEGDEQGFKFRNCYFGMLDTVLETTGNNTASEIHFIDCKMTHIRSDMVVLNNLQSFNIEFHATDVETIFGNIINIESNGGGCVKAYGGSWIIDPDNGPATDKYVLNMSANAATGANANPFIFHGVRFELKGTHGLLVNAPSTAGTLMANFESCTFWNSSVGAKDYVNIYSYHTVHFNRCAFSRSGVHETFNIATTVGRGSPGIIKFLDCYTDPALADNITFGGNYGHVCATGSKNSAVDTTGDPRGYAQDFDLYGTHPSMTMPQQNSCLPLKTASIMYSTFFPATASAVESTVKLPPNAWIMNVYALKPASGSATSTYQLHVGNNDKSTIHGSSSSAQVKDEHKITVTHLGVNVGATDNERTIRLWMTGNSPDHHTGGYAVVEYY